MLSVMNYKFFMVLEVVNIVFWKWNLKDYIILCDFNCFIVMVVMLGSISED